MIMQTVLDTGMHFLAVDQITPETPPQSQYLIRIARWFLWLVLFGGAAAIIYVGGKFMVEKWNGDVQSPKQLVGILVGGVMAVSSSQILNAILPS